jgi:hypothetical protein
MWMPGMPGRRTFTPDEAHKKLTPEYFDTQPPVNGLMARAVVLSYTELNVLVEKGKAAVILQLEVYPRNAPAFTAFVKRVLSLNTLNACKPGKELKVRYDPGNLERIALEL